MLYIENIKFLKKNDARLGQLLMNVALSILIPLAIKPSTIYNSLQYKMGFGPIEAIEKDELDESN